MKIHLLSKYNIPAPRYTSYPTVPYWQKEAPTQQTWINHIRDSFHKDKEISLYVHLPYCESLCTYCGCNKRITKNHKVELPYVETVIKEWKQYLSILPEKPTLKELHLGGGTPTFFDANNLKYLVESILEEVNVSEDHDFSFEAHPASTTYDHLATLKSVGFNRLSIGVQDFDNEILKIINRQQTYEDVERVVLTARQLGYNSINFDLIFGLPLQTPNHIISTVEKVNHLRPERIAFYSYAHVPWSKPSQRAYSETDLPKGLDKMYLYDLGKKKLNEAGYLDIGLDHFALPGDALYKSVRNGTLNRNFMGYTPFNTRLNLAIGVSAISDSWTAYVQNEKSIERYKERVEAGEFPIIKGHILSQNDQIIRRHILNLICNYHTSWLSPNMQCEDLNDGLKRLQEMKTDNLIHQHSEHLKVTSQGKPFIRNICMAFDAHYWKNQPQNTVFSNVV
jgi:oxygen-independent coproporphyrinogen III oxidase